MKNLIVLKFGGSSLSDLKKISNVVEIIWSYKAEGHDLLVVVSAMGAMTDELKSMANQIDDNPAQRELDMLLSVGERVSMSLLAIGLSKRKIDCVSLTGSQSGIITNDCHNDAKIIDIRPHRLVDNLKKGKVVIVAGYQGQSYKNEITTLGRG